MALKIKNEVLLPQLPFCMSTHYLQIHYIIKYKKVQLQIEKNFMKCYNNFAF